MYFIPMDLVYTMNLYVAVDFLPKKRAKVVRQPWTNEEMEELTDLFANNFNKKKCPTEKDIRKGMATSKANNGPIFKAKRDNWETIKKKVWNMIK